MTGSSVQNAGGDVGNGEAGTRVVLFLYQGRTGRTGKMTGAQPMTPQRSRCTGSKYKVAHFRSVCTAGVRKKAQVPASGVTGKTWECTLGQEAVRRNEPEEHLATWLYLIMKYQHSITSIHLRYRHRKQCYTFHKGTHIVAVTRLGGKGRR